MAQERRHATERTHVEGFISGEGTRGKREGERAGGKTDRQRWREKGTERWEVCRALLEGNIVSVHRRRS